MDASNSVPQPMRNGWAVFVDLSSVENHGSPSCQIETRPVAWLSGEATRKSSQLFSDNGITGTFKVAQSSSCCFFCLLPEVSEPLEGGDHD